MTSRARRTGRLALTLAAIALSGPSGDRVRAQVVNDPGLYQSGMLAPRFPNQGDWAEVVTATPRWLVFQNARGQQFPVAVDHVGEFVVRWPTSLDRISPQALVEATGLDLGSNQVRTDHIDVFEGAARGLVRPGYQPIIGFGRTPTWYDYEQANTYGVNYYNFLLPGEEQIPARLNIVGPVANLNPLRIAVDGNNAVAVFPAPSGFNISQVTIGTLGVVRPGDLAYLVPAQIAPRGLTLEQLVIYKSMPIDRFAP